MLKYSNIWQFQQASSQRAQENQNQYQLITIFIFLVATMQRCKLRKPHFYSPLKAYIGFLFQIQSLSIFYNQMQYVQEEIARQEELELENLNQQLRIRAEKFGAEFVPLTSTDYKLFKIQKARETGNINYLQNILLDQIQDLQERKQKIQKRLQQFYPELRVQPQEKFFEQKQTPNLREADVQIRENAWNLFGVDYMSNQLIRNYFHINPHFRIEWINDSSCNIIFKTGQEAQQALKPLIKGEGMRDQDEIWYQLPDYEVQGVRRKLFCRIATNKDTKKNDCHGHKSQYYRWMINKQKLNHYVKKKAHSEIMKTKGINRQNRHHKTSKDAQVKREKKEEQESSSSGVEDSPEMAEQK